MNRFLLGFGGCLAAIFFAFAAPAAAQSGKLPKLVLSGPYAAVSNPLIHMVESGALKDVAETVEFQPWKDPDQLRVLALDDKSNVDFVAMPTNVAANLYNRGVKLRLINVSTWGVLWMVSREKGLKTLADFKGKEILMPFRADMPDIVFQALAEKQGLDVQRDFKLRYVGSPLDAMQLLIMRRADHALLAEPAVSVALRKTQSFPISLVAPALYRSVDLQEEWARALQRPARIPQAGMVALGKVLADPVLIGKFQRAYAASLAWCEKNPDACGKLVAQRVDMLTPEGVADSVRVDNAVFVTARDAKPELDFFLGLLHARQPALIGGKLPDDGFYFGMQSACSAPWLAGIPAYLWSGWGAIASLCLLLAAWEGVAAIYGSLILPDPGSTFAKLHQLLASGVAWPALATSARRAMAGLALAICAGSLLGLAAGVSPTASAMARPLVTVLLGMPPIAWLVLAMLWFGVGDGTPIFTVFIACFPVVFGGALQGTRTLDHHLKDMATVFRLPRSMKLSDLYLPHVVSYPFPAWINALGTAWKVVVMAELLSASDGIGAALAVSRSHLDMEATLAWIAAVVLTLLAVEYLLLEPLKREVERWREVNP